MQLHMKLILLARVCVPIEVLALSGGASPCVAAPSPQHPVTLIERVDFVLDTDAQTKKKEEEEKKRKAEQRRAAAAKAKSNPKAASAATAGQTGHGVASSAPEASSSQGAAASTPAVSSTAPAPASSAEGKPAASASGSSAAARNPTASGNNASRPARLTREQLSALMPGATVRRTNTAGALRQWVNGADGTLTVYWAGGGLLNTHSASGKWSVTGDGHFCLQIDWPDTPENWCRFLEPTASGAYQPVPDVIDAGWTPPKDKTEWRPLTIRR